MGHRHGLDSRSLVLILSFPVFSFLPCIGARAGHCGRARLAGFRLACPLVLTVCWVCFSFDDSWDGTPPAWLGRWEVRCSVIPDVDRAGRWAGTQERSGMLCGILSVACIVFCCITLQRGVGESITRSGVE